MIPVDLLVVGGMTVDRLASGRRAAGGAARYATEAARADGHTVGLLTVAGPEPEVAEWLAALDAAVPRVVVEAANSITFEHSGSADTRRLRLTATVPALRAADLASAPAARAILFGPVAGEVPPALLAVAPDGTLRVAGIQGWLRRPGTDGWIEPLALTDLPADLALLLRQLDLLVASERDIGEELLAPQALVILRAWAGPRPELVITAGAAGAWLQAADGAVEHVPPTAVADGRPTVGAGDAFAASLAAHRGAGTNLAAAVRAAAAATATWLENRTEP